MTAHWRSLRLISRWLVNARTLALLEQGCRDAIARLGSRPRPGERGRHRLPLRAAHDSVPADTDPVAVEALDDDSLS
jgi:hypothetical protein